MNLRLLFRCGLVLLLVSSMHGASPGDEVIVVFNRKLTESRSLAEYYARKRQIPPDHLFGFDLPETEAMTRGEFEDRLAKPLLKKLRDGRFLVYPSAGKRRGSGAADEELPNQATIRYLTLCYGVPVKILHDPKLVDSHAEAIRPELRRNDAAVDSELSLLPVLTAKPRWIGALTNRCYGVTNTSFLNPTNGLLLVARLDGPTPELARGLVDRAMQAEADGLWGRAYFDLRGLTNTSYKLGDDWIRGGAQVATRLGFETVINQEPATFPASYPMSHIALYAGWYDGQVSGPFARPQVEFMPGAFAYHLHSFSAQTLRSATANWVGPLIAKGVTATMGCVEEPYLEGTPDIMAFLVRFLFFGFSFGEAAYACQNSLSWQTTVVGDPLYRPCARQPLSQHEELIRQHSKLVEWSHLRVVNLNLIGGLPIEQLIDYLEHTPDTRQSAILLEKSGDLCFLKTRWDQAATKYQEALARSPSPQQRVRLMLARARTHEFADQTELALQDYEEFVRTVRDYPDLPAIYRKLSLLAEQLGRSVEKVRYDRELERLSATGPSAHP